MRGPFGSIVAGATATLTMLNATRYVGNTLMWFSVALFVNPRPLAVLIPMVSTLYHERIMFYRGGIPER